MKTLMTVFVSLFAVCSVGVHSAEYKFVAADQSVETKLCMAATTNDVKQLKKVLRRSGERLAVVRDAVKCNTLPITEFSEEYGFMQVARFLGADKQADVIASTSK
jgi:imidazole glycerol phosphate synthase subunit HisF